MRYWRWGLVIFAVATVWVFLGIVPHLFAGWLIGPTRIFENAAQIGDSFGVANSFFSAMALIGVIVAIAMQSRELRLQREELLEQRKQFERSAEAQEDSERALVDQASSLLIAAYLNALSTSLAYQESLHDPGDLVIHEALKLTQKDLAAQLDSLLPTLKDRLGDGLPASTQGRSLLDDPIILRKASRHAIDAANARLKECHDMHSHFRGRSLSEAHDFCRQLYETLRRIQSLDALPSSIRGRQDGLVVLARDTVALLRRALESRNPHSEGELRTEVMELIDRTNDFLRILDP